MIVHGTVLQVEPVNGTSDGQAYSYLRAHVLDGIDVLRCRISDTFGKSLAAGQIITASATVNAYKDRSQGARIGITLLAPLTPSQVDALVVPA